MQAIEHLLSTLLDPVYADIKEEFNGHIKAIQNLFSKHPDVKHLSHSLTETIQDYYPNTRIKVMTGSHSPRDFLGKENLHVIGKHRENDPLRSLGYGARRSLQMALLELIYEYRSGSTVAQKIILIDEPELYLHPQAIEQVRSTLKRLSRGRAQVIFATHTAAMVASDDIPQTLLIRKDHAKGTYARERLADAVQRVIKDAPSQIDIMMELGHASQLLF